MKKIFEKVQAAICNLPYNTCHISKVKNSEHSRLTLQDNSDFPELLLVERYTRAPGDVLCSSLQLKTWYGV